MGSAQLALAESNTCDRQTEPGSRHAISEQCPLRRVDAPPTNGSGNMGNLRQARGRPLRLIAKLIFLEDRDALAHDWPKLLLYAFPPITLILQVIRQAIVSHWTANNITICAHESAAHRVHTCVKMPKIASILVNRQDGSMLSCSLHQILTLPSECRSKNRDSSDQATAFQSSIVQFWRACVNCSLFLFIADRSGTLCGLLLL